MWVFHLLAVILSAVLFSPTSPLPQCLKPSVLSRGLNYSDLSGLS